MAPDHTTMNHATKPGLPEPPLVGEVSPPQRVNGGPRHRSASHHGNGALTVKQEKFAQACTFGGLNHSDAYRHAYNTSNMAPSTVWRKAHQVGSNGKVRARIGELARDMVAIDLHDATAMHQRVLNGLLHEATTAASDSARVQAWIALGRMFDISPPPRLVGDAQSLRLELVKRLDALLPHKDKPSDN
jgi:hypothetical protein